MRERISTQFKFGSPLERRSSERETTVLRIGVISSQRRTSFCVLRNISERGVQVRLFDPFSAGEEVIMRVGDGEPVSGTIVWVRGCDAGLKLKDPLSAARLMRLREHLDHKRRRSIPRVQTNARAIIRSDGRTISAQLHNISSMGAKLAVGRTLQLGAQITLILPGMSELRAYVCWSACETIGVRFQSPVSIDLLAHWLASRNHVSDHLAKEVWAAPPAAVGNRRRGQGVAGRHKQSPVDRIAMKPPS